jgi:hypothetical protein
MMAVKSGQCECGAIVVDTSGIKTVCGICIAVCGMCLRVVTVA